MEGIEKLGSLVFALISSEEGLVARCNKVP